MEKPIEVQQTSDELLNSLSFCVFDLETTGGNQEKDQIIEIGLVQIRAGKIVAEKNYLIQPDIKIPEFIQRLTSISPKHLEGAPHIEDVVDEVLEFMGDSILVAHNASFDVPFFNSVLHRLGKPLLTNKSLCTNLMTKYLIPNLMNSNLNYMSKIFKIQHEKAHRALDDALAAANLLLIYLEIFKAKGINKVNHLYYPSNKYELDRAHVKNSGATSSKEILQHIKKVKTPLLVTLKGENGIILFSLPMKQSKEELSYLESKLQTLPWLTATVRMVGPFIETVIQCGRIFTKIEPHIRDEIYTFLVRTHLKSESWPKAMFDHSQDDIEKTVADFVIIHHLVPEQFVIYPTQAIDHKMKLIFRYPGHKKKLIQFINSKLNLLKNPKNKNTGFPSQLQDFLFHYLQTESGKDKVLFIDKELIKTDQGELIYKKIDHFTAKIQNPSRYPQEYL